MTRYRYWIENGRFPLVFRWDDKAKTMEYCALGVSLRWVPDLGSGSHTPENINDGLHPEDGAYAPEYTAEAAEARIELGA